MKNCFSEIFKSVVRGQQMKIRVTKNRKGEFKNHYSSLLYSFRDKTDKKRIRLLTNQLSIGSIVYIKLQGQLVAATILKVRKVTRQEYIKFELLIPGPKKIKYTASTGLAIELLAWKKTLEK